ncbi:hypothetical protein COCVIDRAFT_101637, partial [Bipolaris victoriae FI3]
GLGCLERDLASICKRTVEPSRPQCSLVTPTLRHPTRFHHTNHLLHDAILDAIV